MDVQTRRTPAVPDGHQLMQAAGASSELVKNLHILIRSAIPGSVSVRGVDETAWEVLKSEIRNSLNWLDEHNITIRE